VLTKDSSVIDHTLVQVGISTPWNNNRQPQKEKIYNISWGSCFSALVHKKCQTYSAMYCTIILAIG